MLNPGCAYAHEPESRVGNKLGHLNAKEKKTLFYSGYSKFHNV